MTPDLQTRTTLRLIRLGLLPLVGSTLLACAPASDGAEPTPIATSPSATSAPSSPDCASVPILLTTPELTVHASEEIEVSIAPAGCLATSQWAGEIVVRSERADYPTGVRMELGASVTSVSLPAGISGDVFVMLVPDQDCADVTSGDCHYPYVAVSVAP